MEWMREDRMRMNVLGDWSKKKHELAGKKINKKEEMFDQLRRKMDGQRVQLFSLYREGDRQTCSFFGSFLSELFSETFCAFSLSLFPSDGE